LESLDGGEVSLESSPNRGLLKSRDGKARQMGKNRSTSWVTREEFTQRFWVGREQN